MAPCYLRMSRIESLHFAHRPPIGRFAVVNKPPIDVEIQRTVGEYFAALHARDRPFIVPNPWDAGTARVFARLGFEALATTGGGRAFSLGLPDGSTRPDQLLSYAAEIVAATDLPVTADLEDGFGDTPQAIYATIIEAARAGLVGASIEDRSYGVGHRCAGLVPYDMSLAAERIAAAVDAANSLPFPFVVTARCENFLVGRPDLDDTIRRLQAYQTAGAHCLYAPGLQTLEQVRAVVTSVDQPVNVLIGRSTEPMTADDLARLGVRRISVGSGIHRAALAAIINAAQELQQHGTCTFANSAIAHHDANALFAPWGNESTH